MTESEFFVTTSALLTMIEAQLDVAGLDIDVSVNEGLLELAFSNGSSIIVNRHAVNQEIWVAARGGGFHYRFDSKEWHNTRSNTPLLTELAEHISRQAGVLFTFDRER